VRHLDPGRLHAGSLDRHETIVTRTGRSRR